MNFPRSLYIHIPFCLKKCHYCDFNSIPFDKDMSGAYINSLQSEISSFDGGLLDTVYIGGGTPTVLGERALGLILDSVQSTFNISKGAEITIEANPGTINPAFAASLKGMGVNRLSIGVQSLNDFELKTLGRIHTAQDAYRAVSDCAIENLSIDLMYGIPGQTLQTYGDTLKKALLLPIKHISAYELTPECGTPLMDSISQGNIKIPDEDIVLDMQSMTVDALLLAGFSHYEISNYAIPGCECRHNQNYWRRGQYLGAGAGAHGFVDGVRYKNASDLNEYIEFLSNGGSPKEESYSVNKEEALKEEIFLGLRTSSGIDIGLGYGKASLQMASEGLMADGLMEVSGGRLRLTDKGFMLYNAVVVRLFEGLGL